MMSDEPIFFQDQNEFRRWLRKNHKRTDPLWIGFYKRSIQKDSFNAQQAHEVALCFGWSGVLLKGIDYLTYKVKFGPRKPGGSWSATNVKQFLELKKQKKVHPAGEKSFKERKQNKTESGVGRFTGPQLRQFKANKRAWEFFCSQAPGYRKYMEDWVAQAKRKETQAQRLQELIRDSASGTKLKRILKAQEKFKNRFEPGKTPIEEGLNLGAMSGIELRSIGIETLEELKRQGWERAFEKLVQMYPHRLNRNMLYALAGAVNNTDRRRLDPELKAECAQFFDEIS